MPGVKGRSGRPPEARHQRFLQLINNCWTPEKREEVLNELIDDCKSRVFQERHESRKLLFAYTFGKPTERVEHNIQLEQANKLFQRLREDMPEIDDAQLREFTADILGVQPEQISEQIQ